MFKILKYLKWYDWIGVVCILGLTIAEVLCDLKMPEYMVKILSSIMLGTEQVWKEGLAMLGFVLLSICLSITISYLADLILEEGKREISCGYTYELCEENGRYIQRKIRGNHVAVVDAGRAGPRVCIKDEHPAPPDAGGRCHIPGKPIKSICERSTISMKKTLVKKLARMARDGDPEAIEAVESI